MGRRLAFDQAKGRLWVICERCSRWNLTPLEERWEAIEACEKFYRDATKRVATDEIGLAKVNDGLALVRIGRPVFPEYASWRYGVRFARRRRRYLVMAAAGVIGGGAVLLGAPVLVKALFGVSGGFGYNIYSVISGVRRRALLRRPLGTIHDAEEGDFTVKVAHANVARLIAGGMKPLKIEVETPVEFSRTGPTRYFEGDQVRPFLRMALPQVNHKGGTDAQVGEAVRQMGLAEGHADPIQQAQRVLAQGGYAYSKLTDIPQTLRVGFEMAVMEAQERRWLETELSLLAVAWKEAEQLAGIADSLTLPEWVGERLSVLKRRPGSSPE